MKGPQMKRIDFSAEIFGPPLYMMRFMMLAHLLWRWDKICQRGQKFLVDILHLVSFIMLGVKIARALVASLFK